MLETIAINLAVLWILGRLLEHHGRIRQWRS
jgi:hypothetical protein